MTKKILIGAALIVVAALCWQQLGLSITTDQSQAERVTSRTRLNT